MFQNMDWNCNRMPPFVSPIYPSEMMQTSRQYEDQTMVMSYEMNCNKQEKKKRLTSEQVESLESSFQEDIKLDPDRKMKLAMELGMQPRQIAVWFQNRRARWKTKQLEQLYHSLKQDYYIVSTEKQRLQEEVVALRGMIKAQDGYKKPVSRGYTEISREVEAVESTSKASSSNHEMPECSHVFNIDDYNGVMPQAYWGGLPSMYQS